MHRYLSILDYKVFYALNSLAGRNAVLDQLFIFLGVDLAYIVAAVLIIYFFFNWKNHQVVKGYWLALISFILARWVIAEAIRLFWDRHRPYLAHSVHELLNKGNEASFPSGHATAMFAIAASLYFYDKKLGFWLFVMAVLTGICRVIISVHYPSDILGGAVLGIAVAWMVEKIFANRVQNLVASTQAVIERLFPFTKRR